uniref:Carboxypeptidase regulatory-like domain-containing protein n=1 Tax=Roseihalotalea indica TaxID=2867963 RepID=A0AA49JID3_9BACT|nr:carboxypeptidase regulatory-like domain-containing protein [Tunicatimonas sp. TK19036]
MKHNRLNKTTFIEYLRAANDPGRQKADRVPPSFILSRVYPIFSSFNPLLIHTFAPSALRSFIKNIIVVMMLLLIQGNVWAGEDSYAPRYRRLLAQADALYERFEFQEAVGMYQQVLQLERNCVDARIHLARCYHHLREPTQVVAIYQKIDPGEPQLVAQDMMFYAQALESTGAYEQAVQWYERYQTYSSQPHISQKIAYLRQLDSAALRKKNYFIQKLSINSSASDFAPAFYQGGIVFASARPAQKGRNKVYGWHQQSFLNLYFTQSQEDTLTSPQLFSSDINTDLHEGPVAFYNDGKSVVFTRNPRPGRQKGEVLRLQLFFAERSGPSAFEWKSVTPFKYNHWSYSVGHPAITMDGEHLYFVSDMPDGYGGTDLYVCHWRKGSWSKPQNLGPTINTPGDELFPSVQGNQLYFASNGHPGFGGLDVFKVPLENNSKPMNMGTPINSPNDDFGFIIDSTASYGYFSSNREAAQSGDDNIYYFSTQSGTSRMVSFTVLDSLSRQPIPEATVALHNHTRDTVLTLQTNQNGKLWTAVDKRQSYSITVIKAEYSTLNRSLPTQSLSEEFPPLLLQQSLMAKGIIRDTEDGKPIDGVNLTLKDQKGQQQQQQTDTTGSYAFPLEPDQMYELKVEKDDYFNQTIIFDTHDKEEEVMDIVPKAEKIVVGKAIRIDKLFEMDNIYYGLDKWEIQPEAAKELDKLVQLLKDNATVYIELNAHTDARGSSAYNLRLSELRAMAAFSYITAHGIDAQRVVAKGYGEKKLINKCRDGVRCSEEEHFQNRRTEFTVTKY